MNTAFKKVSESFGNFAKISSPYLNIQSEESYEEALEIVRDLMDTIGDTPNHRLDCLFDILSKAIDVYENAQPDMQEYLKKLDAITPELSILRVLMDQHNLGVSDFSDEIGSKSYVSMILNGERRLNKEHIAKLAKRFSISPALFF